MTNDRSEIVVAPYYGYIVAQTDLAIGLAADAMAKVEMWLPKSQVYDVQYNAGPYAAQHDKRSDEYEEDTELTCLAVPRWLAQEHDLDVEDDWNDE